MLCCSWSGGKDSCLALHRALVSDDGSECQTDRLACLVTMFTEGGQRSRSHGLAREVLAAQAAAIGVPLLMASATWDDYERAFIDLLKQARDLGATTAVFGDIDIPRHRAWEEKVCDIAGLTACLPLWQKDRHAILEEWWQIGGECRLVVAREKLVDRRHLGRVLDRTLAAELAATGIDPCGENGEFHTCVTACPLFRRSLKVTLGDQLKLSGCWFHDLQLRS
jgi:diphthine-ammonia ligase